MNLLLEKKRVSGALKVFSAAFKGYKRMIVVLSLLGIIGGFLEGIGVNMLIPILSFAIGEYDIGGENIILKFTRIIFSAIRFDFSLKYLLIFVCLLFIIKSFVVVVSQYVYSKITSDYEAKTRANLVKLTLAASWPYLLKQKVGYLDTVLMTDVRRSALILEQIAAIFSIVANLGVYLFVALNIFAPIAVVALAIGLFLTLILKPLIYKARALSGKTTATNKEVAHFVNESIIGAKTIKAAVAETAAVKVGDRLFDALRILQIRTAVLKGIGSAFSQPVSIIFVSIIFAIFYKMPGFSFAHLAAIAYLIQRIFVYIQALQNSLQRIVEDYSYLEAALAYKKEAAGAEEKDSGQKKFVFLNDLRFDNASFAYENGAAILDGLNFKIQKGEMAGLVGQSGSGKTTISDLLLRLYTPSEGKILLDGTDIAEIDIKDWRRHIGYVSQDIFLKNDSFENNIKFYDESISREDMVRAAKMANIYDLINESPKGFQTIVGERGVLISGGQRQRIVLARALARNPEILILDEATSSLDMESEALIQQAINSLKRKMTVLIIAHRLQTITGCDRVFVLEGGRIVEEGAPEKLFENKESYLYKLANLNK